MAFPIKISKGFTFIEVLVTIAVLIIISVLVVSNLHFFQSTAELNESQEKIVNALRLAQNKTLASESGSRYGLYFANNQYTIFKGVDYSSTSPDNLVYALPARVEIYDINLNDGGTKVVFNRLIGQASSTGSLGLRIINDPTQTKTICLVPYIIDFCESVTGEGRLQDNRHIHFDLGWSIQNATALKFNFYNAGQIEIINTTDYFNGDKTEFEWEGEFIINGEAQEFEVRTHSLGAFNTNLSIHYDQENTEEVIVYFVDAGLDKEIVRYLNDGSAVAGPYAGTMEIQ